MSKTHEVKDTWETIKERGSELAQNVKEKGSEFARTLEKNPDTKKFMRYAETHKKETILGAFMVLGLILSFTWVGGFIVGLGAGYYSPWGIKKLWNKGSEFSDEIGKFPSFVWLVTIVFMVFHVFSFVVGGVVGLSIKSLLTDEFKNNSKLKIEDKEK